MRTMTVSRPKQYADRLRTYTLQIDGQQVGKLKAGQSVRLDVEDDAQVLVAKVDWVSGQPLQLAGLSDAANIRVKNTFSHKLWIPFIPLWYSFFARDKYLTIEVGEDEFF